MKLLTILVAATLFSSCGTTDWNAKTEENSKRFNEAYHRADSAHVLFERCASEVRYYVSIGDTSRAKICFDSCRGYLEVNRIYTDSCKVIHRQLLQIKKDFYKSL